MLVNFYSTFFLNVDFAGEISATLSEQVKLRNLLHFTQGFNLSNDFQFIKDMIKRNLRPKGNLKGFLTATYLMQCNRIKRERVSE